MLSNYFVAVQKQKGIFYHLNFYEVGGCYKISYPKSISLSQKSISYSVTKTNQFFFIISLNQHVQ